MLLQVCPSDTTMSKHKPQTFSLLARKISRSWWETADVRIFNSRLASRSKR